ncbi:MAG: tetratricopeptide repeat protein [Planctomycetota bacterium]|nr:tetratricopeptide repeat protein [Planctomycetota bacterium]MDA1165641.1 tetratricopeptide repeat protein [Planctomycetota bacterium]
MFNRLAIAAVLLTGSTLSILAGDDAIPVGSKARPDAAATIKPSAEELYNKGRDALFRGKYEDAITSLKEAVAADGNQTTYRLYLARAYRYAKQPEQSETLLAEILKQAPDHVEAGQLLAEVYYSREKWKDVTQTLERLLKYRHDYPTYHLLAEAAYNQNDHENARKYYREAIKLNPDSGPDHYQLGNIYLAENRFALAARSYETSLRLGLDSVVLHYKLASAYFNLRNYFGRISEATVKAGEPGTISGNLYLIERVPGQKDVFRVAPERSAVFHIERAIEGGLGERADTQMLLANVYLNARRFDRAYEMYGKLRDMVPEEDAALYAFYFAQSAFGVRKYDEYLNQLHEAVKLEPEAYRSALVDGYLQVADRYNQGGQLNKYIDHLALAVDQSPQTTSLHLKLATAYEEARKYEDAVQQWRLVLDLEPEHPDRTRLLNLIRKHS